MLRLVLAALLLLCAGPAHALTCAATAFDTSGGTTCVSSGGVAANPETVIFTATASQNYASSTAETSLIPTGVGTLTLPANFWVVGRQVRVKGRGFYSSAVTAPTVTIRSYLGSTVLATASASSLANNAANLGFSFEELMTCRSTGASGTVQTDGAVSFATANGLVGGAYLVDITPSPVNTTTAQTIGFTGAWSAASASNSVTVTQATVEVLN